MKVEERDNELYVYPDTAGAIFELLVAPGKLYGLVVILLLLAATEGITAFLIILLVLIIIYWILIPSFQGNENAYLAIFDRNARTITLTMRSSWRLWKPEKKILQFADLVLVVFSKDDENNTRLALVMKGKKHFPFVGAASVECAEKVSRFMRTPLRIVLGNERITHLPWVDEKEGTPVPTPCEKCGAPLPVIAPGMMNIKCSHCGMTMVISWSEGRISYKAAPVKQDEYHPIA